MQGFSGLLQAYTKVEEMLFKVDQKLYEHFKT